MLGHECLGEGLGGSCQSVRMRHKMLARPLNWSCPAARTWMPAVRG